MSSIPTLEAHLAHIAADGYYGAEMKTVSVPLASIDDIPGPYPVVPTSTMQVEVCEKCRFVTATCLHDHCTWRRADGSPLRTLSGQLTGRESGEQEIEDDSDTSLICDFCGLDCT